MSTLVAVVVYTVSTGDCESDSKTEECSNLYLSLLQVVLYIIVVVNA